MGATNSVAAAGPLVGGLLTQYLDRRWTLFVHLPVRLAAVAMKLATAFVVSALAGRFGPWLPRATIGGGLALIALRFATQAGLDAEPSDGSLVAGLVVAGLGVGLVTPSLSATALATNPPVRGGIVGGGVNTIRPRGLTRG
ncbi:MFS transporter, partial [Streptomyces sp. NPDC057540]